MQDIRAATAVRQAGTGFESEARPTDYQDKTGRNKMPNKNTKKLAGGEKLR